MDIYSYDSADEFLGREPYGEITPLSERDKELLLALPENTENGFNDGLLGYDGYQIEMPEDGSPPVLVVTFVNQAREDYGVHELLVGRWRLTYVGGAAGPVADQGDIDAAAEVGARGPLIT